MELDKWSCLVVNVHGLVHIQKFQIEEINETALYEKIVQMYARISITFFLIEIYKMADVNF